MSESPNTARQPQVRDVTALVGMLSVLEGEVWAGGAGADNIPLWAEHLATRLRRDGLLADGAGNEALRQALGDLNQRLRFVLGEHDEPNRTS